jgi:hypothetical protein
MASQRRSGKRGPPVCVETQIMPPPPDRSFAVLQYLLHYGKIPRARRTVHPLLGKVIHNLWTARHLT